MTTPADIRADDYLADLNPATAAKLLRALEQAVERLQRIKSRVTDEMVNRFLTWRLPDDFGPDCGIHFTPFHPNGVTRYEPVGTNLLTAEQARAMLEHVLAEESQ
jgi:hypothetical protein